ncbi:MAG: FkbM family methyltransferase [Phycisphaerales bacterium]|nr:MAG: FkbM family methyltransferase [Phycisphaerales bacterium]
MTTTFAACEQEFFTRFAGMGFEPTCILDIGGSNAAWSTTIHSVFPDARYEIFEPLAGRREDYDRILEWALRTHPNFRLHTIALGADNSDAEFWSEPAGVGSSLLVSNVPKDQKITVPVRRLDDYLADQRLSQPQLIKIDVQGGEREVITGGAKTIEAADVLHLETWLTRGYGPATPLLTELIDTLRPMGHVLVQLGDFWRKPSQELASIDAFFVHTRMIDRLANRGEFPWPATWSSAA